MESAEPVAGVDPGGFRELLSNREFQKIWASQITSQLADKFLVYSLLSVTYERSAANTQEAIVLLAYTFPSVLLSPIAGVYADRFDKRRMMAFTNVIRGGLIMLVPLSSLVPYFRHVTWHLLVVTLLFSSVGQFFAPAEASSLPFIMPRRNLVTATSVFTLTIVATLVVGLPVSSVLVRLLGQASPYFVAAALFLVAAGCNAAMTTNLSARTTERPHDLGKNWAMKLWSEMTETAAFLRVNRQLLRAFGQLGLAVMLIFSLFTLAQGYMKTELHLDPRDSYLILVPAAAGMALVAVYLGRGRVATRGGLISYALMVLAAVLLLMGTMPGLLSAAGLRSSLVFFAGAAGFVFGGAFGAVFIPAVTLLQESTDPEQRGRTFGAMFTVLNLAIAVPLFIAGLAADTFGLKIVLSLMGVLLGSAALAARPWRR
ncbi:MAG: MFS transporter [Candidatus Dormibacteria bacterium]